MKARINITIILCSLMAVFTFAGCKDTSCSCFPDNPGPFDHYTPDKYTISWTSFNPVSMVQEYFYHHDSTLSAHDGDTIMLFGRLPDYSSNAPRVGAYGFYLTRLKNHYDWDECGPCYSDIEIATPEGTSVEPWMTKGRVVFVKGKIRNLGYRDFKDGKFKDGKDVRFRIDAIQLDSVKF